MEGTIFVQYLFFALDPAWHRLPEEERRCTQAEFTRAIEIDTTIRTYTYTATTGLKAGIDLLLWRIGPDLAEFQAATNRLLKTRLGAYLILPYIYDIGLVRPSTYIQRQQLQEQTVLEQERSCYLVLYPFTKTTDWYLLSKATRQGMMNEHIKIGHEYSMIQQALVHCFGLDDQEFVVAYEMDNLLAFQTLIMDLRSTDGRAHTLRDTPQFTAVHRPLEEALALVAG